MSKLWEFRKKKKKKHDLHFTNLTKFELHNMIASTVSRINIKHGKNTYLKKAALLSINHPTKYKVV